MGALTERPILFRGEMVRAILEGRKSQTRRVVKPQPSQLSGGSFVYTGRRQGTLYYAGESHFHKGFAHDFCPYGVPGDRLWVRETFLVADRPEGATVYAAAYTDGERPLTRWKPSIFMPRARSRITLEITGVRVERVQQISGSDAKAEGIEPDKVGVIHIGDFVNLWNRTNAKRELGWDVNPWCWVIEFKRV